MKKTPTKTTKSISKKLESQIVSILFKYSEGNFSETLPESSNPLIIAINYLGHKLALQQEESNNRLTKIISIQEELIKLNEPVYRKLFNGE
jgi:hypothetical protein